MVTLKEQLTEIVKSAKILNEDVPEDEDRVLGVIDKFLNESVDEKCEDILKDS